MKIITLCGSLKFKKEMMIIAEKMALEGKYIITPVYPVLENYNRTINISYLYVESQEKRKKGVVVNSE